MANNVIDAAIRQLPATVCAAVLNMVELSTMSVVIVEFFLIPILWFLSSL